MTKKALDLQDLLTSYLAGKGFDIITRQDVITAASNISGNAKPLPQRCRCHAHQ